MKKIIILFFFLISGTLVYTQDVTATAGETNAGVGYIVSWTLGEPVIETFTGGSNSLTQGFHQSRLTVTSVELFLLNYTISVFPNPTNEFVNIQVKNFHTFNARAELYSTDGKLLKTLRITDETTILNVKEYPNGSYLLKLRTDTELFKTFKVVKMF